MRVLPAAELRAAVVRVPVVVDRVAAAPGTLAVVVLMAVTVDRVAEPAACRAVVVCTAAYTFGVLAAPHRRPDVDRPWLDPGMSTPAPDSRAEDGATLTVRGVVVAPPDTFEAVDRIAVAAARNVAPAVDMAAVACAAAVRSVAPPRSPVDAAAILAVAERTLDPATFVVVVTWAVIALVVAPAAWRDDVRCCVVARVVAPPDTRADVAWIAVAARFAPAEMRDAVAWAVSARVVAPPERRPDTAAIFAVVDRVVPPPDVCVMLGATPPQSQDSVALFQSVVVASQSHGPVVVRMELVRPEPGRRTVVACARAVLRVAPLDVRDDVWWAPVVRSVADAAVRAVVACAVVARVVAAAVTLEAVVCIPVRGAGLLAPPDRRAEVMETRTVVATRTPAEACRAEELEVGVPAATAARDRYACLAAPRPSRAMWLLLPGDPADGVHGTGGADPYPQEPRDW